MTLATLTGHLEQRRQVSSAIRNGKLPQLILLTGPEGVGKQRFGLWIAQRLFCEVGGEEPCNTCRQCRLVANLAHPDLHWFMPVLRPKASEPDKQIEELEESIGEVLEQRRKEPLYGPPEGLAGHFVATARLIGRRAMLRPVEGQSKVFLIGYSERLVPQEASPEAANALLKLFEEPSPGTYFILAAADIENVLPTIRSRSIRMRLGRLGDDAIRTFFRTEQPDLSSSELESRVRRAGGAIGGALGDGALSERARRTALAFLESARTKSPLGWEVAIKQTPFSARGEFTEALDAMAEILVEATRSAGTPPGGRLSEVPRHRLVAALGKVGEAREMAQNNVNPQVLLAVLNQDLAEVM